MTWVHFWVRFRKIASLDDVNSFLFNAYSVSSKKVYPIRARSRLVLATDERSEVSAMESPMRRRPATIKRSADGAAAAVPLIIHHCKSLETLSLKAFVFIYSIFFFSFSAPSINAEIVSLSASVYATSMSMRLYCQLAVFKASVRMHHDKEADRQWSKCKPDCFFFKQMATHCQNQLSVSSYTNPCFITFLDSPVSILRTLMTVSDRHHCKIAVS